MPTIRFIDSFQHRVAKIAGPWYTVQDGADGANPGHGGSKVGFDTGQARTANHACSLKIAQDGTNQCSVQFPSLSNNPGANLAVNIIVWSFYIRVASNPGVQSEFWTGGNATDVSRLEIDTTGHVVSQVKAGTAQTGIAVISDGNWHRIDVKLDYSTTTGKLDVQVDGVANTQATATVTVGTVNLHRVGSTVAADNLTAWYSDYCVSGTSADYPIGDHICLHTTITGAGTHNKGTAAFSDQTGATTDAALIAAIDDAWDGTTPELTQNLGTDDYIQQTSLGTSGTQYVAFTLATPSPSGVGTYWNVQLR